MEVLIPTRNDYKHLEKSIEELKKIKEITNIHVIDNASKEPISDIVKALCKIYTCVYHYCAEPGKGNAIKVGIARTTEDLLCIDADLENIAAETIKKIIDKMYEGYDVVKATFKRANGQSNSAFITKEFKKYFPELHIQKPTGGIYTIKRNILKKIHIPSSWNVDVSILLQAYALGAKITEVDIGIVEDKFRESIEESRAVLVAEVYHWQGEGEL